MIVLTLVLLLRLVCGSFFIVIAFLSGEEALSVIISKLQQGLSGTEQQAANVEKYSSLDKGPATYGVVKRMRDNDMELHTDQQVSIIGEILL